jgi:dCTP diphosphatase
VSDQTTTVAELRRLVAEFVAERHWEKYHDAKNLSASIAIEAAELMEHFQWVRNDEVAQWLSDPHRHAQVIEELADVLCYALSLANVLNADISGAVRAKIEKNRLKYPAEEFRGVFYRREQTQ